jgi:hypothetical protein
LLVNRKQTAILLQAGHSTNSSPRARIKTLEKPDRAGDVRRCYEFDKSLVGPSTLGGAMRERPSWPKCAGYSNFIATD